MSRRNELDDGLRNSLSYETYLELMTEQAAQPTDGLDDEAAEKVAYTQLNLHRSLRIARTYRVSAELATRLERIDQDQTWLILTEPWCGDSAQCLPHLEVMSRLRENITLKILLRDQNLDVMDRYLTDGKRSIPRLVVFDADGRELYTWGPRPAEAQAVFDAGKEQGLDKPQILEKLHLFYGRNRGRAQEAEFIDLLSGDLDAAR